MIAQQTNPPPSVDVVVDRRDERSPEEIANRDRGEFFTRRRKAPKVLLLLASLLVLFPTTPTASGASLCA